MCFAIAHEKMIFLFNGLFLLLQLLFSSAYTDNTSGGKNLPAAICFQQETGLLNLFWNLRNRSFWKEVRNEYVPRKIADFMGCNEYVPRKIADFMGCNEYRSCKIADFMGCLDVPVILILKISEGVLRKLSCL
jgi:hypothetical protein